MHNLFPTGKDRRCKYLIDGFVEDLSVADLRILAQLEVDNPVEFGKVGYRFRKQFNEGWFDGIVVKVLSRGGKILSCIHSSLDCMNYIL